MILPVMPTDAEGDEGTKQGTRKCEDFTIHKYRQALKSAGRDFVKPTVTYSNRSASIGSSDAAL
jgi:hypothetical protein